MKMNLHEQDEIAAFEYDREVTRLNLFVDELVNVLKWYADSRNYHSAVGRSDISIDGGQRARDILKERL